MSRYAPRHSTLAYSLGPGPITPAVKWIIIANIVMYVAKIVVPDVAQGNDPLDVYLGLIPRQVVGSFWIWQPVTYLFLHGDVVHILFNMLGVWMFGVTLERQWGTHQFLKYYAVAGIGAGLTVIVFGLLPFEITSSTYTAITIGASGALYGLLLAFAIYYPDTPILMFFLFPVPARYFVMIIGAIALLTSPNTGVSNAAHLGGLLFGWLYLRRGKGGMSAEIKYRYLKWKMNRMRRKFDVYSGGRSDWDRHVH
jgi:membrane associated rhomboid family serine protease